MSELPRRTQVYTVMLVILTFAAFGISWYRTDQVVDASLVLLAALLLAMIFVAEVLDISFPQSVTAFHVSVSAAFCFAAGLTVGPLLGGIVVALAHFIDGAYARRQLIKTVVNAANIGLSTNVSAVAYFALADSAKSPIGSLHNILAVLIAVVIYTLINTVSLALIVSPVMGMGPFEMWRANISGFHVELISVATLGSLIPVLVAEQPLSVVLLVVPLLLGPHLAFKGIRQAHRETRVTMEGLADALERRDPYTSHHSIRVTEYVRAIVGIMPQIPRTTADAIVAAARVHDLGKVGSRDGSLKKPGDLTEQERQEIQQHAAVGAEIVGRLDAYRQSVATIRHHHERWDGSGYPDGLAGEEIPLGSRIIGVADAFDAMTSDRVYRPALPVETALAELRKGQGTQFDPLIVELFVKAHAEGLLIPGRVSPVEPGTDHSERQLIEDVRRLVPKLQALRLVGSWPPLALKHDRRPAR